MSRGKYKSNISEVWVLPNVELSAVISAFEAGRGSGINDGIEKTLVPKVDGIDSDSSYTIRVSGNSMTPVINPQDLLIINTAVQNYRIGDIVAVVLNGDYLIKIYEPGSQCLYLASFNQDYEPIRIYEDDSFKILGKATKIVRDL